MAGGKNARKTKYNKKTYETMLLRFQRDGTDGVTAEDVKTAAARAGMSQNAYMLMALQRQITCDEPALLSITTDPNECVMIDESLIEDFSVDFDCRYVLTNQAKLHSELLKKAVADSQKKAAAIAEVTG